VSALAPSVVTRNTGRRLYTNSDDISMKRLVKPSAHTPRGIGAPLQGLGDIIPGWGKFGSVAMTFSGRPSFVH